MHIANVLLRGTNFGPLTAISVDLVVHDFVLDSRYKQSTTIVCREIEPAFDNFNIRTFVGGSKRRLKREVVAILDDLKPDLIVIHEHLPTAAAVAARFSDVPVIVHRHVFVKPTTGLRNLYHRRRFRNLAGIVFVSGALREEFCKDYPGLPPELFVIHNGLPLADWSDEPEKSNMIVAVGSVHPKKGSLEIAKALVKILPDYPEWRATFFGNFSDLHGYGDRVKAVIKDCGQIISTGYIPFPEVVAATKRAKIAVVNSQNEPFGRVAIEAFAARTALICSVHGGLSEVIGDAALPLKDRSAQEIETHLRTLIENQQKREQIAQDGRTRFEQKTSPVLCRQNSTTSTKPSTRNSSKTSSLPPAL